MAKPTDSFKQFNYGLRPSKQVERKIMIEVLLRLTSAGYRISDYTYLGFGSVYYIDFVMFHKYLFICDMVCVEWGRVEKRMRFNKPFKFIKLKLGPLLSHIPKIRRNKEYLVWLDYDRALDPEMLQDIDGCLTRLGSRSIFISTVDARPKLPADEFDFDLDEMNSEDREKFTARTYREWFGAYTTRPITRNAVSGSEVAPIFAEVLVERIRQTLSRRGDGLRLIQIFNYVYKDGAPMLTLGGIVGSEEDETALRRDGILGHDFIRTGGESLKISLPLLTIREKQWLDSRLDKKLTADKLTFELEEELLQSYRLFSKEYPTFLEALL
jgi:hypothetical protein